MNRNNFTSESVTCGHPDKICDQIADRILDALLEQDPQSRVACEVTCAENQLHIFGEVTSQTEIDYPAIARQVITEIGYTQLGYGFDADTCVIHVDLHQQSPDIARGITRSREDEQLDAGAGDQGMMFGYACNQTPSLMPLPIELAHELARRLELVRRTNELPFLLPDGKTQVTVEYDGDRPVRIASVLVAAQHREEVSTDADGNLIVTVGGKEYNIGSEKSQKQMGTVVPGITSLHFRSGPGIDQEIIGYLHSGDTVEIVEKCGDWYKVNFNGKTGYAHGKYLNVTDSAKDSSMFSEDALKLFLDLMQSGMSSEDETESSTALTPEGNMTLVDDIGEEEDKSSQQFITLVTKAGNTFYLIIDRDKDGNQNVHFLNMVDEADLLALMDEEEAAKYQEKEPEVKEPAETEKPKETEPAPEEQKTESEEKKASPFPMIMLLLFVIGAAGVGGYLYVKMKGVKPAFKKNQPDPDADYHDEDEDVLQLPEDDGDEDEEVDVNEDYEAESDDEPV